MADLVELHGRVVNADGRPVPEAIVMIPAGSVPVPEIALIADANGGFVVRLPPGRFLFRAVSPEGSGEIQLDAVQATAFEIITRPGNEPEAGRLAGMDGGT